MANNMDKTLDEGIDEGKDDSLEFNIFSAQDT